MAHVTKVSTASLDAISGAKAVSISGLFAGEALDAVAPCYIDSDGSVKMSVSSASAVVLASGSTWEVKFVGFTADNVVSGEPVTLFGKGSRFGYGTGMTPGTTLFSGSVAGTLSDSVVLTNDVNPLATVISATDVLVIR